VSDDAAFAGSAPFSAVIGPQSDATIFGSGWLDPFGEEATTNLRFRFVESERWLDEGSPLCSYAVDPVIFDG
jgi:hypothetical protein